MSVKVVTDSTADLPPDLASKLGVIVVPLSVHFGDKTYLDGVDLQATEFYKLLVKSPKLPTTSQPPVGSMIKAYTELCAQDVDIVSIHISSRLSGTLNSAQQAKGMVNRKGRIDVVDSMSASVGLGLVVIAAARAASQGAGFDEVVAVAKEAIPDIHLLGVVDTLTYMEKGGRIGKAQAFLGSLLHIKPIIGVRDGEAYPVERVRSRERALERLYQMTQRLAPVQDVAVAHSTTPEEAAKFAERVSEFYSGEIVMTRFGPVMGTYLGPGALGVAVRAEGASRQ